jgi:hypothetical protein
VEFNPSNWYVNGDRTNRRGRTNAKLDIDGACLYGINSDVIDLLIC